MRAKPPKNIGCMRVSAHSVDYSEGVGALSQCIGVAGVCMLCLSKSSTVAWPYTRSTVNLAQRG